MEFRPYIYLYGRCKEALDFYKTVLGGTYEAQMVAGSFAEAHMPPETRDGVLHAAFTSDAIRFFASDGRERRAIDPDEGNIALAITADSAADGERMCGALAEGGKVVMQFDDAPWGGKFGNVADRFGIEWIVTAP